MTQIVDALPEVSGGDRARIMAAPREAGPHRDLMGSVPAMSALELGGTGTRPVLPDRAGIAAWNVERCLFPEDSAAHLAPHGLDIVLLSEMDHGMARTAQRNTTRIMADALGMSYAYGVEFFEMDLGGPTERPRCVDDFNARGWHGNAILSSVPFERLELMRLDQDGHWFGPKAGDIDQPRLGGRMAVAAVVPGASGPLCVVSTHLESNADAGYRAAQFTALLDAIDRFAPDMPVLIGGDLNTGNHLPPDFDWQAETLFDLARARGYAWDLTTDGTTTRPSLITPHPGRVMKLDWFCSRAIRGAGRPILSSVSESGTPLSDHDCVICDIET